MRTRTGTDDQIWAQEEKTQQLVQRQCDSMGQNYTFLFYAKIR